MYLTDMWWCLLWTWELINNFYVMTDTAIIIMKTLGATIQKLVSWVTRHLGFSDISSHHIPIQKY